MDTLDLEVRTNGTFVQAFTLDAWADLYDFSLGHWHSMLRRTVETAIANYEWSTENDNIAYSQTLAHGEIAFTSNPEAGDTLTIGTTVVTFDVDTDLMVGSTLAATITTLVNYLNASADEQISLCTYAMHTGPLAIELAITFKTAGSMGNAFPFDTSVAGSTPSNEDKVLSGGGGALLMTAPVEDISMFSGEYIYDIRFESDDLLVPIVGGMMTFTDGVTRDTDQD